jgi:hypothetical protein
MHNSPPGLDMNNVPQVQMLSTSRKYTDAHVLTATATHYALTRFSFSPFIIRLNRLNVNISSIKSELLTHVTHVHHFEDEHHQLKKV